MRIHITTDGVPLKTVSRAIGKTNVGVYCTSCGEFMSFAVEDPNSMPIEFTSDEPLATKCPLCGHAEKRHVAELLRFPMTEAKKRRK